MEITTDSAKILASKLNKESLKALMITSNAIRDVFNTALSDDYTYKLMTEELLDTSLAEYRNHKWKDVYYFFTNESDNPSEMKKFTRKERRAWFSMPSIDRRLDDALFSSDPVIVNIGILVGNPTSARLNNALVKALREGNSEVAKLLMNDNLTVKIAMFAFKPGDIRTIRLVLDTLRVDLLERDKEIMVLKTIQSGNVEALEFLVRRLDVDIPVNDGVLNALKSGNGEMVTYFLELKELPYNDEMFLDDLEKSYANTEAIGALITHPRVKHIVENNKNRVLKHLIHYKRHQLLETFLKDDNVDISSKNYELIIEAIKVEDDEMIKELLSRPEVHLSAKMSLKMLTSVPAEGTTLCVLLDSEKIRLNWHMSKELMINVASGGTSLKLKCALNHEKVIINKKIAEDAFKAALCKYYNFNAKILLEHPRTKIYYTQEDIQAADKMRSTAQCRPYGSSSDSESYSSDEYSSDSY